MILRAKFSDVYIRRISGTDWLEFCATCAQGIRQSDVLCNLLETAPLGNAEGLHNFQEEGKNVVMCELIFNTV